MLVTRVTHLRAVPVQPENGARAATRACSRADAVPKVGPVTSRVGGHRAGPLASRARVCPRTPACASRAPARDAPCCRSRARVCAQRRPQAREEGVGLLLRNDRARGSWGRDARRGVRPPRVVAPAVAGRRREGHARDRGPFARAGAGALGRRAGRVHARVAGGRVLWGPRPRAGGRWDRGRARGRAGWPTGGWRRRAAPARRQPTRVGGGRRRRKRRSLVASVEAGRGRSNGGVCLCARKGERRDEELPLLDRAPPCLVDRALPRAGREPGHVLHEDFDTRRILRRGRRRCFGATRRRAARGGRGLRGPGGAGRGRGRRARDRLRRVGCGRAGRGRIRGGWRGGRARVARRRGRCGRRGRRRGRARRRRAGSGRCRRARGRWRRRGRRERWSG